MSNEWIETKKEFEVDDDGNMKVIRVTKEIKKRKFLWLELKDGLDLMFKVIGIAAIFTPIFLFYKARTADYSKQRISMQFEVYSAIASELQTIIDRPSTSPEFHKAKDRLLLELSPKIHMLGDTMISGKLRRINEQISQYAYCFSKFEYLDSLDFYSQNPNSTSNRSILQKLIDPPRIFELVHAIPDTLRTFWMEKPSLKRDEILHYLAEVFSTYASSGQNGTKIIVDRKASLTFYFLKIAVYKRHTENKLQLANSTEEFNALMIKSNAELAKQ